MNAGYGVPASQVPVASDADRRSPAPGSLELVRQFLNTVDVESGEDDFGNPSALASWLAERGLLPPAARLDADDLEDAIEFREALRDVLEEHAGHHVDAAARERLDRAAARVPLRLRLVGSPRLVADEAKGVGRAIGGLLAIAYQAMAVGTWERLKVCRADTCRWAFYDASRNRSGSWCTMQICGNRQKARRFRRRRATTGPAS